MVSANTIYFQFSLLSYIQQTIEGTLCQLIHTDPSKTEKKLMNGNKTRNTYFILMHKFITICVLILSNLYATENESKLSWKKKTSET